MAIGDGKTKKRPGGKEFTQDTYLNTQTQENFCFKRALLPVRSRK
jgi:hypothetical protein